MSPARAPASMVMLLTVIRPSIESASTAGPAYSTTWPVPPAVPTLPMIARMRSFAVQPNGRVAVDGDPHRPRRGLDQGLRGKHVLDLRRPDAEGERSERTVGGGVAVAAHDCRPRQGEALLGADDVDDSVARIVEVEQIDPELLAVADQGVDLEPRVLAHLFVAVGGDVVVDDRDGRIRGGAPPRPAWRSPS